MATLLEVVVPAAGAELRAGPGAVPGGRRPVREVAAGGAPLLQDVLGLRAVGRCRSRCRRRQDGRTSLTMVLELVMLESL